ncbi:MAG TPA: tripartite tricarboxylate transporter substrate binding protein [Burkholderiales bacterium]|jgi:tripartite-type tricarboxylate transporter receptor subunit TctC
MKRILQGVALALAASTAVARPTAYPQRPITLVVTFAAGGGTDALARELAKQMQDRLGAAMVVDNRGGAGGMIGVDYVAQAPADGYTLLFATSTFITRAAMEPPGGRDVLKEFVPIAMVGRGPLLVTASENLGVSNISGLIARARAKPGSLNFCSPGAGSINHLAAELFDQRAGISMTHVPYKGSAPAVIDLLAGQVQVFFASVPNMLPHIKAGKVKLLAVTSRERSPQFAQTPTVAESGLPGFEVYTWWGLAARKGTPPEIIAKLNGVANQSTAGGTIRSRLLSEGAQPFSGTSKTFGSLLDTELHAWKKTVATAGIRLEN